MVKMSENLESMETQGFIVVGGGPAGITLATHLANASSHPKVLLIEAGGVNDDVKHLVGADRFRTLMTVPDYSRKYKSVPQKALNERVLDHNTGRGLGGGSAVNFAVFTRGPKNEYDRWAREVEDEDWSWDSLVGRWRSIESMAPPDGGEFDVNYIKLDKALHGSHGDIKITTEPLTDSLKAFIDHAEKFGYPKVLDHNGGDPRGVAVVQVNVSKGRRMTAAEQLLNRPSNLSVLVNSTVTKLIVDGDARVTGVELEHGRKVYASKEVILSAGYISSPKILLLSGIGPKTELEKLKIPSVLDLPGVGLGLQDHTWIHVVYAKAPESIDPFAENTDENARAEWVKSQSGPLSKASLPFAICYLHNPDLAKTEEFSRLEKCTQEFLADDKTLHYEVLSHMPPFNPSIDPTQSHTFVIGLQNPLSKGTVKLRSADPADPPIIDAAVFSHPFDRVVAIDSVRKSLEMIDAMGETLTQGPEDRTDEGIWKYISGASIIMWHGSGTVATGPCVDSNLRLKGAKGLRVADTSVIPFVPSAHTQAAAYAVGATAAVKIIREYNL